MSFILRLKSGIRTKIIIGGTFMFNNLKRKFLVIATVIGSLSRFSIPQNVSAGAHEQYFPIASSRVGPYSAMGTGYYGAQIDYLNYVNMNGGVNGVMLTYQECETEYNDVKTAECYQRLLEKDGRRIVVFAILAHQLLILLLTEWLKIMLF